MDEIQKVLVKAGRKDLAISYYKKITASFLKDSDGLTEEIIDFKEAGKKDKALISLAKLCLKKNPVEKDYNDFKAIAKTIKDVEVKKEITKIINNIDSGKYKAEFKGKLITVTKKLFSVFKEAYHNS